MSGLLWMFRWNIDHVILCKMKIMMKKLFNGKPIVVLIDEANKMALLHD